MKRAYVTGAVCILVLGLAFPLSGDVAVSVDDGAGILQQVDQYRSFSGNGFSFDYAVREHGSESDDGIMKVFVHPHDPLQAVVRYEQPARYSSRRILVSPGGFWMQDRGMRHPIRISAQQMLFGQAAAGDVTSVSFRLQYDVADVYRQDAGIVLELQKKDGTEVSYPMIRLLVDDNSFRPQRALFFSQSGREMRRIVYEQFGEYAGREMLELFRIENSLSEAVTHVRLSGYSEQTLPAARFNRNSFGAVR